MNLLEARLLQTFIAVAEERHFGRAARRLHLSQPPVSQRIRHLEDALGVPLLIRSTRQVELTPAGSELYRRAVQLVQEASAAEAAIRRYGSGEQGELRVGFTRTVASQLLPKLLAHYHAHKPDVSLHLQEDWSTRLIDLLLQEKLDVALLRRPAMAAAMAGIHYTLVDREPLWLVVARGHRLARRRKATPTELRGEIFVGYSVSTAQYFHETLAAVLASYDIEPRIPHHSAIPTILALVGAGMGVALVPRSAARSPSKDAVAIPLDDPHDVAHVELYAAARHADTNPGVAGLISAVLSLCRASSLGKAPKHAPAGRLPAPSPPH